MTARGAQINDRMRALRSYLDLTQAEMAARMGVSLRAYQTYEAGESLPKATDVGMLAASGADLHWLLTGENRGGTWVESKDGSRVPFVSTEAPTPASPSFLDEHLLAVCIDAVDTELALAKRTLPSARKAAAISALYELLADEEGAVRQLDHKVVQQFIKLAG